MASIASGTHKVSEILEAASFDFHKEAAVDYNDAGVDYRRVKVGGLSFDSLDEIITVPPTANEVTITLDGASVTSLTVELDDEAKKLRAYSFETAADADDK